MEPENRESMRETCAVEDFRFLTRILVLEQLVQFLM